MSKETAKKATFKDLIAKKLKKEEEQYKTKDIYIVSMDAILTFKKPKDDLVIEAVNDIQDTEDISKMIEGFKKIIYHSCDMLQDTKLHEELDIKDPYDIVNQLFDLGEVIGIGEQLMDLVDVDGKVETIKN